MIIASVIKERLIGFISDAEVWIKKASGIVWRFLTMSLADESVAPDRNVCVAIEKGRITVASGTRSFSRIRIKGIRQYNFEQGRYAQPENIAAVLPLAMNELKAAKSAVTLCIPKDWTIIKAAEFPAAVKESLSSVVSYELDRFTPLTSDNAFYGFRILGEGEEKVQIQIEAAKYDLVRSYLEALRDRGILVARVTHHLSALSTVLLYCKEDPSIYVEIESDGFRCGFIHAGVIERTFTDSFNSADDTQRIKSVIEGIESVAESKTVGSSPSIIVRANANDYAVLTHCIPDQFRPKRVENIECDLFNHAEKSPFEAIGGLLESLWPKAEGLNLLSKGMHRKEGTPMALTGVLSVALLVAILLYMLAPLQIEERRIQELDRQIALRKDEVRRVETLIKEADVLEKEIASIENFKSRRPITLNVLRELTLTLPKNAWLSRVRITDTTVDIEGYASSATELLPKLEASRYLKKVEFASPTFRDVRANAERFVIKMEIDEKSERVENAAEE
jgi:general secretion pathway protein L